MDMTSKYQSNCEIRYMKSLDGYIWLPKACQIPNFLIVLKKGSQESWSGQNEHETNRRQDGKRYAQDQGDAGFDAEVEEGLVGRRVRGKVSTTWTRDEPN